MSARDSLRAAVRSHRFVAFVVLTFAVTWTCWGVVLLVETAQRPLLQVLGGLGPLIAGGVVAWLAGEFAPWTAQLRRWRVSPGWWAFAAGVPVALILVVTGVHLAVGGTVSLDALPPVGALAPILLATLLRGGLEEPGWRGLALPVLQERYGALTASVLLAVVWTAWHLPLFVTQGTSQVGSSLLVYGLSLVPLTVLFTVLYNHTASVLLAMLLHTVWNGFQGWFGPVLGGSPSVSPNVVLLVVLWLVGAVAVLGYGTDTLGPRRVTLVASESA
jgi:membrane protease YdiL (CAAX protease family)